MYTVVIGILRITKFSFLIFAVPDHAVCACWAVRRRGSLRGRRPDGRRPPPALSPTLRADPPGFRVVHGGAGAPAVTLVFQTLRSPTQNVSVERGLLVTAALRKCQPANFCCNHKSFQGFKVTSILSLLAIASALLLAFNIK